jgi:hypothetical protein
MRQRDRSYRSLAKILACGELGAAREHYECASDCFEYQQHLSSVSHSDATLALAMIRREEVGAPGPPGALPAGQCGTPNANETDLHRLDAAPPGHNVVQATDGGVTDQHQKLDGIDTVGPPMKPP